MVDGDGMCIERESELCTEELGDLDRDRSPRGKYPSSTSAPPSSSGSITTIMSVFCDYCCGENRGLWDSKSLRPKDVFAVRPSLCSYPTRHTRSIGSCQTIGVSRCC
jgi:hypothetical protein